MTLTPARLLLPALLLTALALTGCSGSDDGDGGSSGGSSDSGASLAEIPDAALDEGAGGDADAGARDGIESAAKPENSEAEPVLAQAQALIRKGNVALRAHDVGRAQVEVQKVIDRYAGQVSDENTESDDDGRPTYTRMVVRVPSADFSKTVAALKGVAELESATTKQDDVTNEVIDVRSRLAVQKRSIARITVLFQQAKTIRDIMAIEAELSQRQADLEALEQQAAYLANQTSLSTIVVSIDQIPKTGPAPEEEDDAGFVAGLKAGWDALSTFAVGLAR